MRTLLEPSHPVSKIGTRVIKHVGAPLASLPSKRMASRWAETSDDHEPIFIVGPPRCGSTILYQALSNRFDVLYIDNLAARWAPALAYGMSRSMRRFGRKPHNNFESLHGDTARGGWHAPSECGALWYRWIPEGQHFVGEDDIRPRMVDELRVEIHGIQNRWQRPLLVKNLHVGQRLAWVTRSFPNARFVWIHRNQADVVSSVLAARSLLGVPEGELWSTRPRDHVDLELLSERSMVEGQVERIEFEIEMGLRDRPTGHVHHVSYDALSAESVLDLGRGLGLSDRPGGRLPKFRTSR